VWTSCAVSSQVRHRALVGDGRSAISSTCASSIRPGAMASLDVGVRLVDDEGVRPVGADRAQQLEVAAHPAAAAQDRCVASPPGRDQHTPPVAGRRRTPRPTSADPTFVLADTRACDQLAKRCGLLKSGPSRIRPSAADAQGRSAGRDRNKTPRLSRTSDEGGSRLAPSPTDLRKAVFHANERRALRERTAARTLPLTRGPR